jgi:hypothetical protein
MRKVLPVLSLEGVFDHPMPRSPDLLAPFLIFYRPMRPAIVSRFCVVWRKSEADANASRHRYSCGTAALGRVDFLNIKLEIADNNAPNICEL